MDQELEKRILACRADYEVVAEKPCSQFFCPILLKDEPGELCRGHLMSEALGGKLWVPQRTDVDNFYGSVVEADFAGVIEDFGSSVQEIFADPKKRRRHRPKIEFQGKEIGYYFPSGGRIGEGHSPVSVTMGDESLFSMALKVEIDNLLDADLRELSLVIDRNYRPATVAAVLKAAHLTMFYVFGYEYIFRPGGIWLGDILRRFFEENDGNHGVGEQVVEEYFGRFGAIVSPLEVRNEAALRGSAEDNIFLICLTSKDQPFILGVIVRAMTHRFVVFLPTEQAVDTYFSFLKEPPVSLRTRFARFIQGGRKWEFDEDLHISLGQEIPADFDGK